MIAANSKTLFVCFIFFSWAYAARYGAIIIRPDKQETTILDAESIRDLNWQLRAAKPNLKTKGESFFFPVLSDFQRIKKGGQARFNDLYNAISSEYMPDSYTEKDFYSVVIAECGVDSIAHEQSADALRNDNHAVIVIPTKDSIEISDTFGEDRIQWTVRNIYDNFIAKYQYSDGEEKAIGFHATFFNPHKFAYATFGITAVNYDEFNDKLKLFGQEYQSNEKFYFIYAGKDRQAIAADKPETLKQLFDSINAANDTTDTTIVLIESVRTGFVSLYNYATSFANGRHTVTTIPTKYTTGLDPFFRARNAYDLCVDKYQDEDALEIKGFKAALIGSKGQIIHELSAEAEKEFMEKLGAAALIISPYKKYISFLLNAGKTFDIIKNDDSGRLAELYNNIKHLREENSSERDMGSIIIIQSESSCISSLKKYADCFYGHYIQAIPTAYTIGNPFTDYAYNWLSADIQAVYSEYVYKTRKTNGDAEIELLRMAIVIPGMVHYTFAMAYDNSFHDESLLFHNISKRLATDKVPIGSSIYVDFRNENEIKQILDDGVGLSSYARKLATYYKAKPMFIVFVEFSGERQKILPIFERSASNRMVLSAQPIFNPTT